MNERETVLLSFETHSDLTKRTNEKLCQNILKAAELISLSFRSGGKLVVFGNGGSAADSQHFVTELVGRFLDERKSLPAIALTTNSSILTALGNDYGFDKIFERQVEALVNSQDVAVAISTSGNSENVIKAAQAARQKGAKVIALTGDGGGILSENSDVLIDIPSKDTPRIQEMHILTEHIICNLVEKSLSQNNNGF